MFHDHKRRESAGTVVKDATRRRPNACVHTGTSSKGFVLRVLTRDCFSDDALLLWT